MHFSAVLERLSYVLPPVDEPWEHRVEPNWLFLRLAAVTVLLFPRGAEGTLLLIRRPRTMTTHGGQMALPGGRVETVDGSPWQAALREAREEIGIDPAEVSAIGRLSPIQIPASNHLVLPFVGRLGGISGLSPNREEVDAVVEVPVAALFNAHNVKEDVWTLRGGSPYLVTYYDFGGQIVWGATARILSDLAGRIGSVSWDRPPGHVAPVAS